jgi:TPR repeat protein
MRYPILLAFLLLAPSACSTTPGDAAYRSGHSPQAAELYRRGAANGDADAALKLGLMIDDGAASRTAFGTAGQWFLRACDLGDEVGCHNVGVGFEYGKSGLERNYDNARDYYERAASRGYIQSQYNLGSMYANQYFHSDAQGLAWLLRAQRGAQKCASQPTCNWILRDPPGHVARLKARLTPEQIADVESHLGSQ